MPVVIEVAAVLGVLEAVRRVEDQEQWSAIRELFVDRTVALKFYLEALPLLLRPGGTVDQAVEEVAGPFAESDSSLEWCIWLCWVLGLGPKDIVEDLHADNREAVLEATEALARTLLVGGRAVAEGIDVQRVIEMLEAAPRAGVNPVLWLRGLESVGEVWATAESLQVTQGPVRAGELVRLRGTACVVREVRGDKVEVVDFSKPDHRTVIKSGFVKRLVAHSNPAQSIA